MIRTVIFDIGNVLAKFAWKEHFASKGYSEDILKRLAAATVESEDWREYDRGCLKDEEVVQLFVENDPGIEKEIREVTADYSFLVTRYDYAIPWVKKLKESGYQVLVLSNFSQKALRECWNALDFLPYVDGGILSFQDKLIKPDPAIYHLILSRYHLKAEECVFLDDTFHNIEAAAAVGIHTILFENKKQAEAELEKLGVR